jgi:hypothetical protein
MNITQFANVFGETLEQGDVVVIAKKQTSLFSSPDGALVPEVDFTENSYDTSVCGIVCEVKVSLKLETDEEPMYGAKKENAAKPASRSSKAVAAQIEVASLKELAAVDRSKVESGQIGLMVTSGVFAHCKIDADIAPINIGDLLTTSPTKGHAQKALDPSKATGAIIGKALGSLKTGKGKIPVMVMLQ